MEKTTFLDAFSTQGKVMTFLPQQIVHLDDIPSYNIYLILEGKVKQIFYDEHGVEKTILILKKGEIFGEVTCFQQDKNMVITKAAELCKLAVIDANVFQKILEDNPSLYKSLVMLLTKKLRILMWQVHDLSFQGVHQRLVSLIIRLVNQHGVLIDENSAIIDLVVTHQDLANMVGAYRSTVTKVIGRIQAAGLIEISNRKIKVLNITDLQKMKNG